MNIFDFTVLDADGKEISLKEYEGKVILINNSATKCGFTPQYDELQNMYEKYGEQGFVVLDFPCGQFGAQLPDSMEEIVSFCDSTYGITFPIFGRIKVNGPDESPLYTYLKAQKGFAGFDEEHPLSSLLKLAVPAVDPGYESNSDIKWNFTKFLIDKRGNVVERYEPTADMLTIEERVNYLLRE